MRRGPLYMILASLSFTVMVSLVKVAREEMGPLEVVCWRTVTSVALTFFLALRAGFAVQRRGVMVGRVLFGFAAMVCFFTAAKALSLADLAIVSRLQPLLVAMLAPLLLGAAERGGWVLLLAVACGLGGTAVLLGPELAVGSIYGWIALAGAVCSALAHVSVRSLGGDTRPEATVFWFQLGAVVLSVLLLLATTGGVALPPRHLWPHLAGCGVAATVGQVLMTRAYAADPAPLVAAAAYVAPLWGVLGDLLIFSELPGVTVIVGGSLVVLAGLLLLTSKQAPGQAAPSADTPT
jgi:drug/metabolite transporter (DMT)-like permease